MTQRSEDPARNLRSVWLGPTGAWRWPFDATYVEWAVAALIELVAIVALWLVLPFGAVVLLGSWAVARWTVRRLDKRIVTRWGFTTDAPAARRRVRRALAAMNVTLALLLYPSPSLWLQPMPIWLALLAATLTAAMLVRHARPWIDGNRPVAYWLATFRAVAGGPRARRAPVTLAFGAGPAVAEQPLDEEIVEFLAAVAAIETKEIRVSYARRRAPVGEYKVWDPTSMDESRCQHVVAWLRFYDVAIKVEGIKRREMRTTTGRTVAPIVSARVRLPDGTVLGDHPTVVVLTPATEGLRIETFTVEEFQADFEEVHLATASEEG